MKQWVRRMVALAVLAATLASTSGHVSATDTPPEPAPIAAADLGSPPAAAATGETAVVVRAVDAAALDDALETLAADGIEPDQVWDDALHGLAVSADADVIGALRSTPGIVVEVDQVITLSGTQANPPWGLDRIDQRTRPLDNGFSTALTGAGVDAYVLDTGINLSHTEFAGRIRPGFAFDFGDSTGVSDCNGHGTHVSGTLGGTTFGVAKQVSIVPVKVFSCTGDTPVSVVVMGINWIIANHLLGQPAVVNMSLGGTASSTLDAAVAAMIADGITVVVAAGNSGTNSCWYSPARVAAVITVAAIDRDDGAALYSNYGPCNDLFAPGTGITSAAFNSTNGTAEKTGTSMASPHVAGVAAMVLQANPTATPAQVWMALSNQTTPGVVGDRYGGYPDRLLYASPSWNIGLDPLFTGVVPSRFYETRAGYATVDGLQNGVGRLGAEGVAEVAVAGRSPIPCNAGSVALNITVTNPEAAGFVTAYPCGISPPGASSVNFTAGGTIANTVVSKVGGNGRVCVFANVATDLIVDVTGWFSPIGGFTGIDPARLLETRPNLTTFDLQQNGIGMRSSGLVTAVAVTTRGIVPSNASAAVLNVTVTNPAAAGFVTVYPCGSQPTTLTSSLNFRAGQTIANGVISKIGTDGQVCLYTQVPTDIIVDVTGYFGAATDFTGVVPARFYDSRPGYSTVDGLQSGAGRRETGWVTEIDVLNRAPISASAGAVVLNVTVTNTAAPGYVMVYPCGSPPPTPTSSVNFGTGDTVANSVVSRIGAGGKVCVLSQTATDLIVDVTGWFPA
ncbi:MAG: S8 family peptidase [Ilumatobacteraceae bacterium]